MTKDQLITLIASDKIKDLIENGISEPQIQEALDVPKKQWKLWKEEIPEFRSLMDRANGLGLLEAQSTLMKKARGYYYTEERQEIPIDTSTGKPKGDGKLIKEKKWCPPDDDALNKLMSIQLLNKEL